jgi:hypothetical protein
MPGQFHLTGGVRQAIKDSDDIDLDQDVAVLTGWSAVIRPANVPINMAIPDGDDITYLDERIVTLLADGQITEDGVNPGIYLTAHDDTVFDSTLQWKVIPARVTLSSGKPIRPRPWVFDARLAGESTTLGELTPVAQVAMASVARGPQGAQSMPCSSSAMISFSIFRVLRWGASTSTTRC